MKSNSRFLLLLLLLLCVVAVLLQLIPYKLNRSIGERDHSMDALGHAAIVILHNANKTHFLLQRKTKGYPYSKMVDTVCFFGGNREAQDSSARETLLRELNEELPSYLPSIQLQAFARYLITAPLEMMHPKPWPYSFECCVFHAEVDMEPIIRTMKPREGQLEIFPLQDLQRVEKFAWGYDAILSDFMKYANPHQQQAEGLEFRTDYAKCGARRLGRGGGGGGEEENWGSWGSQEEWK